MARSLKEVLPPPEEALELEPEELAMFVLEYLRALDPGDHGQLNRYNFTLTSSLVEYAGPHVQEIAEALTEAWVWLEREGFIAPEPGQREAWVFVTRRAKKMRTHVDFDAYRKSSILPSKSLDPVFVRKVRPLFIRGDYEPAVFQAFKEVEVRVRETTSLPADVIGVSLVRRAFDAENGSLTDKSLPRAEREAMSHLFAGAIGLLKNPSSHRHVELSDPAEAAEVILFANYLLRIVESRRQEPT